MSRLSWRERVRRMNQRSLFAPGRAAGVLTGASPDESEASPPAGQARAEAVQRLQVGLFGIGAMVLLVGLASIIGGQAERNDQLAAPEAAPTTEPSAAAAQANPLADAGVVPDIAAEPSAAPSAAPVVPDAPGNAAPAQ
ncbi:hypothetical protein [Erythrobacter sp. BLCC-B19]|uniref:hypothetical protein n=1 Tax=Erythrobacter sp. BLCC-B19 TaxID=3025315 RepID=UPI0023617720|nr:hypothetical protein [Erythrobacter sp. BLCC-B19]WDA39947.1 hypothetical protein PS060_10245 [Erythrobacter sp. BLCC-B19]